jgi:hypothetical protein
VLGTSPGIESPFARIPVVCDPSRAQYRRADFHPDSNVLEYSATDEGGGWQRGCSQLLVDPKGSMSSRQSVRAPLKSPEQSCLLSFPLNCPKKIWVHVSTKHKATVVRHRKKTLNPGPRAESSSAYCPGPLVKAAGMFIEIRGGFGHCGNGPRAGCGVARASC